MLVKHHIVYYYRRYTPRRSGGGHADDLHRAHDGQILLVQEFLHPVGGSLELSLGVADVVGEVGAVQADPVAVQSPAVPRTQRPDVVDGVDLSNKLIGDSPPSGFIAMRVYRQAGLLPCGFIANGGEILP